MPPANTSAQHHAQVPCDPGAFDHGTPRCGKICFVDLAGSERLKVGACGGWRMCAVFTWLHEPANLKNWEWEWECTGSRCLEVGLGAGCEVQRLHAQQCAVPACAGRAGRVR